PSVDAAYDASAIAQIIVNSEEVLAGANQRARSLFRLPPQAVGRLFRDVDPSYRPVELRSPLEDMARDRRAVAIRGVHWEAAPGQPVSLDVELTPLFSEGDFIGTAISFVDMTEQVRLKERLERSSQELETAMEELQSTNEELETTNEEVQY